MKIYPIYEFPNSLEIVEEILSYVDRNQPINKEEFEFFIGNLISKRSSRTRITIKEFKKLGLISKSDSISLTENTQLYVDLKAPIQNLLLFCIYQIPELFEICKKINEINPDYSISKPQLLNELTLVGYDEENLSTAREKLFAIIRLMKVCNLSDFSPDTFNKYEEYISFLKSVQKKYLELSGDKYDENVELYDIREELLKEKKWMTHELSFLMERMYFDPIFASKTSFSTVNRSFASRSYVTIKSNKLYYLKIKEPFVDNRRIL